MNKKEIQVLMKEYENFKEIFMELCYPTTCVLCGNLHFQGLCVKCQKKNKPIQEPRCMKCGKPLLKIEDEYCSDCRINSKLFQQGRSLWPHKNEVKNSIYKFKYKNKRIYAEKYAELLIEENIQVLENWKPEALVAIPVHPTRKRIRGYNQSQVLAIALQKEIDRKLGVNIPILTDCLCRIKETTYQKKLDNKQRRKNLQGAFHLSKNVVLPKSILIVDDIYTTGATVQEVSKVLMAAGVENVFFLTISIGQGF